MFIDRTNIHIKGGNGGNGCVSFYRAKYITHGGPDGGDGGKGGDIIFIADKNITTLQDFRYKRTFKAQSGEDGGKRNCSGKDAENIYIKVPVGTLIKEKNSDKVMADMVNDGEEVILIKGGKGGRGNQHFATPTRQAPRYCEQGKQSKEYDVVLELKLLADVGIIGFPNVGKSTFLSMATNANPKIANYHFTTLTPNLGVAYSKWGTSFVLADIPGLIEGASEGAGLGHFFLRHIERTKVLIHMVDASGVEGLDPIEAIEKINSELKAYNERLLELPQIIAANKMDLPEAEENLKRIKEKYEPNGTLVFALSAATNEGIDDILHACAEILKNEPKTIVFEADYEEFDEVEIEEKPFTITKDDDNYYSVYGEGIAKMLGRTNIETEKGFAFFQKYLKDKGIIEELISIGLQDGDTVKVCDLEFDYYD